MENNKAKKEATVAMIDAMIQNADKGPSGFWTDDYEGCGNPQIFPEFDEGLKHGKLVQKEHYLCPWNTAILYGSKRGNIQTGCYHSCSIDDAKYLSKEILVKVLRSFKKRLLNGNLDNLEIITPLLMKSDIEFIEKQKVLEQQAEDRARKKEEKIIREKAADLLVRQPDYEEIIIANYGKKIVQMTEGGSIDFDPDGLKGIVHGEKLTYNDYIDAQINSIGKTHSGFQWCFYNVPLGFKGQIEKVTDEFVCFQRISIEGMYFDGICSDDKEQHIWMDLQGFEGYQPGDCVEFSAEPYRYLKTGNGKQIDYGLRKPTGIKKIDKYELPTDDELMRQELNLIRCEVCYLNESCDKTRCILGGRRKKTNKKKSSDAKNGH